MHPRTNMKNRFIAFCAQPGILFPCRILSVASAICCILLASSARAFPPQPAVYSLEASNWITPVKNQGDLGTCWAFANLTSFQSSLLRQNIVSSPTNSAIDISVWHMATANGAITDLTPPYNGWGGGNEAAIGYWTRGRGQWDMLPTAGTTAAGGGSVMTTNNPLNAYPLDAAERNENLSGYVSPASQTQSPYLLRTSVNYKWNGDTNDLPAFQNTLKTAVTNFGALSIYAKPTKQTNGSELIWFNASTNGDGHVVALDGWDDNKVLVYNGLSMTGGWRVQNSWPTNEKYDGYNWVPFADTTPFGAKEATAYVARTRVYSNTVTSQTNTIAPSIVQNQIFGWIDKDGDRPPGRGYTNGVQTLAASKETIPANSALAAIGLYQVHPGTSVTISAYDAWTNTGPVTNTRIFTTTNPLTMNTNGSGYNMIDFASPIRIEEGRPIYFVVDFGTNNNAPIAVDERTVAELTPELGTYEGLSWMSSNGITWIDLLDNGGNESLKPGLFFMKIFRLAENLDNAAGINAAYDFTVDGPLSTSTNGSNNAILGLNFEDGGELELLGKLTVTGGGLNVPHAYQTGSIYGTNDLVFSSDLTKTGEGRLIVSAPITVSSNATINGGTLDVRGQRFVVPDTLTIAAGQLLTSNAITANASINGGTLNVPGRFDVTQTLQVGGGNLSVAGTMTAADVTFTGGALNVGGSFSVAQTLQLGGGSILVSGQMTATNATITGGTLNVPGRFVIAQTLQMGGGSLSVPGTMTASSASITGGILSVGGSFDVAQTVQLGGGNIIVNGQLTAPGVNIFGGGLLGGSGLIAANVLNGGVVSPGNSPGTLTINGNYTQTSSGTLAMEVGVGAYDRLVVNGVASLAGALAVSTVGGGTLAFGDTYQFLTASGGITGAFGSINMPSGYRGRFLLGSANTQGTLLVAPRSYTQAAVTPNQARVAGALDAFIPATSGDRYTVSLALDKLTASQYPAAFEQIMPSIYASIPTLAFNQANALNTSMFQRMWMQRINGAGFSSSGMAMEPMQNHLATATADKKTVLPVEPSKKNWGVFADGNGIFATANSGGALQDYRSQGGGVTAGASYKWNKNFATGVYAGYQGLMAQYDGGSRLTDNAVRFGGFGTVGFGGWYANGLVGGAYHSYDVSRNIEFGTVNRTARGKPGAGEFDLALATGYDFKAGRFTFGPATSMQYTYLAVQGFNETGADSLNLGVGGYNSSSLLYSLGAQAAYRWEITKSFAVTPMLSANWQHEFLQNAYPINAAFNTGGPSAAFNFRTSQPQQDFFYAGAGLGFDFGGTWGASFFYNAAAGNQDLVSHNIYLSIGAKF